MTLNDNLHLARKRGIGGLWRWGGLAAAVAVYATIILASRGADTISFPADAPGVAVVELFTSEGCASCPPAEELLGELAKQARASGAAVYPLSFHVDYWDRLGWKDPFSQAAFTERQREYAGAFGAARVYTPQMIVNGATEFVGSDRKAAAGAIRAALQSPAAATITLAAQFGRDQWHVDYEVAGAPDGAVLNVALVKGGASQKIEQGENAGRTLTHANIATDFRTVALAGAAKGKVALGGIGSADSDQAVIAYVQESKSRRVIGAARIDPAQGKSASTSNNSMSNDLTSNDQSTDTKGTSAMSEPTAGAADKIAKSDEEWKKILSPEQFRVLRKHGTERAFSGSYWNTKEKGVYVCAACGQELFAADAKFDSGTGWPSYWEPIKPQAVGTQEDRSLWSVRTEVHCSRCGGHLGHVFDDGPRPTGLRYCINSVSLDFKPAEK